MSEQKEKKGPMVVVKRAGGPVQTRVDVKPTAISDGSGGVSAAPSEPSQQHASVVPVSAVPAPVPVPVPAGPSVADEVPEALSFAEMFEQQAKEGGMPSRKMPRVGEKVKAKIFQLGAETVFATIGKHEAMIDLDELKDDEGILRHGVGDEIEAHVMETGAKGIVLSRKLSKGAASMGLLAEARQSGLPVEGLILGVNKGGLEVAVGEARAFCPMSQVDVRPVGKLEEYVGQRMTFRVTEVKDRKVVLSRRSILEEESKAKAAELKKTLAVGQVLKGRVVSVQAFGAFVDLGGLEGMIPVSELSHVRVGHPKEVLKVGDEVEVEVIRFEEADPRSPDKTKRKDRLTLSMRKLMEDPFTAAQAILKEGETVKGKVVRLQPFGAFVELAPGVDGLIHISAMSERRIAHPRDVLKVGDEIEVKIEKVDAADKRVGLRLMKDGVPVGEGVATSSAPAGAVVEEVERKAPAKPQVKPRRGMVVQGKVVRVEPFGVFLEWEGQQQGLIPASETGTERGTELKRVFPMGKEVKAEIIEVEGNKVKLSISAAARSEERADLDAWKKDQAKQARGSGGFNSLADKLKGLKLN